MYNQIIKGFDFVLKLLNNKNQLLKFFVFFCLIVIFSSAWFCTTFCSKNSIKKFDYQENKVAIPVIMYHFICKTNNCKNKFTISNTTFEDDVIYLKENGYSTIFVEDLINFTENKIDLPKKPILLTFDDGAYNNYLYAFDIAKKYNIKFIFSPIIFETERYSKIIDKNESYAYTTWEEIKEMSDSGLVEIQNHTYNLHSYKKSRNGCKKKPSESNYEYLQTLSNDLNKAQNLLTSHINKTPTAFFYPFGAFDELSEQVIKKLGFKASFGCESGVNIIEKSPSELFKLKRYLRPPYISSKTFFQEIDKIVQNQNNV